jgi:prepilin-type N-terminal cleavage/methylation domain-containing protein
MGNTCMTRTHDNSATRGFTLLEVALVVAIMAIVAMAALPALDQTLKAYRGLSAARNISAQIALARMRAGSDFTRTRLTIDSSNDAYTSSVLDKTTSSYTTVGTYYLPNDVSFGYGSISSPAGGQTTVGQTDNIYFNSRGIPVDSSGSATGVSAVYLNNDGDYYAVTVSAVGLVRIWKWSGSAWVQQ